jgi:hypothetical protein
MQMKARPLAVKVALIYVIVAGRFYAGDRKIHP